MTNDGKVFPTDEITSRERLLAAYRGEPVDRVPYWAKITNRNWRRGQDERVAEMSNVELLDAIHADGLLGTMSPVRFERPHVTSRLEKHSDGSQTIRHETPDGVLVARNGWDPGTHTLHPVEFPVKTREDIDRLRWMYADVKLTVDENAAEASQKQKKDLGERALTTVWAGPSPLMHLVEHIIGPVNTTYLLADHPEEMDELIAMMHAEGLEAIRLAAEQSGADVIISGENTSTTLISPQQFEQYCRRHLVDRGEAIQAAGKMHELHMCGHTHALLERIDGIPASSIEAFTSPTLGNTRLVDGREKAPSKTLIGGTNACVWLRPLKDIREYIQGELDACPDTRRIVLTTAGVAPQGCKLETFRAIGEWLRNYPVRN